MRQFEGASLPEEATSSPAVAALAPLPERDDERPARAPATQAELSRVDGRLLDVFRAAEQTPRGSQARHLAAVQGGRDAILIAATGSGKSSTMFAPAIADYVDAQAQLTDTTHNTYM